MLLVQKYLEAKSFSDLASEHGVYASFSKSGHKFSLNYDQLEAKESDPLSQECRGLILARADGQSMLPQARTIDNRLRYEHLTPGKTQIVAFPMKRFFNHGQGSAVEIDWSNFKVLEKLDGCFTYDSLLKCFDGSVISIGNVVKNKLKPTLVGMDKNGNIVPCQITNWFDNGKKDNWIEIEIDLKSKGKNRKFLVTTNHSLFLNGGFNPAMNAKVGDEMLSFEEELSKAKILGVKQIVLSKNNEKIFKHGRCGYDIETTTNNYIINGVLVHNSLTILYFDKFRDDWCVATRAVPEADIIIDAGHFTFRTLFEKAVKDTLSISFDELTGSLNRCHTYCFELTTPYNRIVVQYPACGITLLAIRDITTLDEIVPDMSHIPQNIPVVKDFNLTNIEDIVNWVSIQNPTEYEGVVLRDKNFNRRKIKNAAYIAFSKARDVLGSSDRNCLELILAEKEDDVIPMLPPEIVDNLMKIKSQVTNMIHAYDELYKKSKDEADFYNPQSDKQYKKTFAQIVTIKSGVWTAPFFQILDNKAENMKDFIRRNRKDGSWSNSFLDKILDVSKSF